MLNFFLWPPLSYSVALSEWIRSPIRIHFEPEFRMIETRSFIMFARPNAHGVFQRQPDNCAGDRDKHTDRHDPYGLCHKARL